MQKASFFLLFFLICFQITKAVSISKKRLTEDSLEYSVNVNLSHYLELLTKNGSAVENKTIFSDRSSLGVRKGAAVKGTIYETLLERTNYVNIDILDSYEEAIKALNNHSIDYFICPQRMIGEIIQIKTENLTYIIDNEQSGQFRAAVVIQNTEANQKLSEKIQKLLQ